jgi:acyl-CoA thioesterase-2
MASVVQELVRLLTLERLEENRFRGQSEDLGWGRLFGGQVLGQSVAAAAQTVPGDRLVHSLNAYFLRPGNVTDPIVYEVDRIRDGGSFTTRRVVAIQSGQTIFNMAASFQADERGFDHQDAMPEVAMPEALAPHAAFSGRPFEVRAVDAWTYEPKSEPRKPARSVWLRMTERVADDPALHRELLAYASDHALLTTSLLPHGVTYATPGMQVASIDHVMWFHRPFRVDEWLLYVIDSPSASGGRGLARGRIFTREGKLVASTQQEGLIRMRPQPR